MAVDRTQMDFSNIPFYNLSKSEHSDSLPPNSTPVDFPSSSNRPILKRTLPPPGNESQKDMVSPPTFSEWPEHLTSVEGPQKRKVPSFWPLSQKALLAEKKGPSKQGKWLSGTLQPFTSTPWFRTNRTIQCVRCELNPDTSSDESWNFWKIGDPFSLLTFNQINVREHIDHVPTDNHLIQSIVNCGSR